MGGYYYCKDTPSGVSVISQLRMTLGLSYRAMGRLLGVSCNTVRHIDGGKRVNDDTVDRISLALGATPSTLFAKSRSRVSGLWRSHVVINRLIASGADYIGANWSGLTFKDCSFSGANLYCANFVGTRFESCTLSYASLRQADVDRAIFRDCRFVESDLHRISGDHVVFDKSKMIVNAAQAYLRHASFRDVLIISSDFSEANLNYGVFIGANVRMCSFADAFLVDVVGLAPVDCEMVGAKRGARNEE